MNKIVLLLLAFFISFGCFSQTQPKMGNQEVCRTGFIWEISQSRHWGYGKPVVTSVQNYSTAEQNGLQVNDVIEFIDSVSVTKLTPDEIAARLNIEGKDETVLVVSNLSSPSNRIWIKKECKQANVVTEQQLAKAFFLLSPETTAERRFICPFKTTVTLENIDFSTFKTFGFATPAEGNSELELIINDCIEQELLKKGLSIDFVKPDLLVHTYYLFDKNPDYKGQNLLRINTPPVYRYDHVLKRMVQLPFLHHSSSEKEAEYILQLGIRLEDQKVRTKRIVWECEARELLEGVFTLENYARIHIPLMCMQYPYVKHTERVPFRLDQAAYNYTGICYDLDAPDRIVAVDRNSPAAAVGIRRGDRVLSIREQKVPASWNDLSASYQNFVTETALYRDPTTRFRNPDYAMESMYWNEESYMQIAEEFRSPSYILPFAYLFSYVPYVDASGTNYCPFVIRRGNHEQEYVIRPSLHIEQTLKIDN